MNRLLRKTEQLGPPDLTLYERYRNELLAGRPVQYAHVPEPLAPYFAVAFAFGGAGIAGWAGSRGATTATVVLLDYLPGWRRFYTDDVAVVHVREDQLGR